MDYFEVGGWKKSEATCSDDNCPCGEPGTTIPRGQGYLVISSAVVEFRRDARTLVEAGEKARSQQNSGIQFANRGKGVVTPILCCDQSPLLNSIDREVAASDASNWWKTGQTPLRATPPKEIAESFSPSGRPLESEHVARVHSDRFQQIRKRIEQFRDQLVAQQHMGPPSMDAEESELILAIISGEMLWTRMEQLALASEQSETEELVHKTREDMAEFHAFIIADNSKAQSAKLILQKMMLLVASAIDGEPAPTEGQLDSLIAKNADFGGAAPSARCFIATATWGTDQAPDVVRLREFRNKCLNVHALGRAFIVVYEALSPPLAKVISRSSVLRATARAMVVRPARWIADYFLDDE